MHDALPWMTNTVPPAPRFGVLPGIWYRDDSPLDATERGVLAVIALHSSEDTREARPTIPLICRRSGLSERTVQKAVRGLEAAGAIEIVRGEGIQNSYRVQGYDVEQPEWQGRSGLTGQGTPANSAGVGVQNLHPTPAPAAGVPPQKLRGTPADSAPPPATTAGAPPQNLRGYQHVVKTVVNTNTQSLTPRSREAETTVTLDPRLEADPTCAAEVRAFLAELPEDQSPVRWARIMAHFLDGLQMPGMKACAPLDLAAGLMAWGRAVDRTYAPAYIAGHIDRCRHTHGKTRPTVAGASDRASAVDPAGLWELLKREGLVSPTSREELESSAVRLQEAGDVADADAFVALVLKVRPWELADARTPRYAIDALRERMVAA